MTRELLRSIRRLGLLAVVFIALPAQAQTVGYGWLAGGGGGAYYFPSGPIQVPDQGGLWPSEASAVAGLDSAYGYTATSCGPQDYYYWTPVEGWSHTIQDQREYQLYVQYVNYGCVPTLVSPSDFYFLARVTITSPFTTSLVDPVPAGEVSATGINPDANGLAGASSTVAGVAADGTTEIVVRIAAPSAGTALQLSIADENAVPAAAGSASALGYLTTLLPSDATASTVDGQPITVTTVPVASGGGAMAFAVYYVPKDFVRDGNSKDPSLATRNVFVEVHSGGTVTNAQAIEIVRPPVAFIHGIWGGSDDGDEILSSLMSDGVGLTTYALGYDGTVTVASSTPSYGSNLVVSGSNLGFSFAASIVLPELYNAIADYRTNNALGQPIAVSQADIVAHSMGGDIARTLPAMGNFTQSSNYEKGPVHKLITIGTPHLGSPLALDLLDGANSCVAWVLRKHHRYAFSSVTLSSGSSYDGGVADLQGGLNGAPLSPALSAIQPDSTAITTSIPTAMIAAAMSSAQLTAVDASSNAKDIRILCGLLASNPLANALTSSGWPTIVGSESDAIVPVNSQLAGTLNTEFPLAAAVHSPGTEDLGFAGPSELDDTAVIPPEVLTLLNTPIDQSVFVSLP